MALTDRTELRSAALQAVFMSDEDGVRAALSQLDQNELHALYSDASKLASWVEGHLEAQFTTPRDEVVFTAPLLTQRVEVGRWTGEVRPIPCPVSGCGREVHDGPCGLDDPDLFPTGP